MVLERFEIFFLSYYTIEILLKIFGFGFIFGNEAFLRDGMNIMDLVIVVSGYIPIILNTSTNINLSSLRVVRVLRPLRTIGRVSNLKIIISALFSAVSLLKDSFFLIMFFYILFAIAGL